MDLTVDTRPVQPDDLGRFLRLWPRLSPETRYRRFHAPVDRLPMTAVRRLVLVDHDLREAVVAVVGGEVVGVARYDRSPDDPASAEFAVVVEDGWQGVGVGRQLLRDAIDRAARSGVRAADRDGAARQRAGRRPGPPAAPPRHVRARRRRPRREQPPAPPPRPPCRPQRPADPRGTPP